MSEQHQSPSCHEIVVECWKLCRQWDEKMKLQIRSTFQNCDITTCKISREQYKLWDSYNCERKPLKEFIADNKCSFDLCQAINTLHEAIHSRNQVIACMHEHCFLIDHIRLIPSTVPIGHLAGEFEELFFYFLRVIEQWSAWESHLNEFDGIEYNSMIVTSDQYIKCSWCNMWIETNYPDCIWCEKKICI